MNTNFSMQSPWASRPSGAADELSPRNWFSVDYAPSDGSELARHVHWVESGCSSFRNGAVFAALVGFGLSASDGLKSVVGSGGSHAFLLGYAAGGMPTTSEATWGSLFAELAQSKLAPAGKSTTPVGLQSASELVADIKSTLGVNVTELAAAARVSRQTIYDWVSDGPANEANYGRLHALHQICLRWQARTKHSMGRLLHVKNAAGQSLLDLMLGESLNWSAIDEHLNALATKSEERAALRQVREAKLTRLSEQDRHENALTHALPAADR